MWDFGGLWSGQVALQLSTHQEWDGQWLESRENVCVCVFKGPQHFLKELAKNHRFAKTGTFLENIEK
jgi:hypothetical protein